MKILGIDPGLERTGWAAVQTQPLNIMKANLITTTLEDSIALRLNQIYEQLEKIIKEFNPDILSIEKFFSNSKINKNSEKVLQARGVILSVAGKYNLKIKEYTPTQIKKSLINTAKATKNDIKYFIKKNFHSPNIECEIDDVYDAIAIALCFEKIKFPIIL